ncbi:MAG: hypothetical protein V4503_08255 [Gemmatimonadota bacterium]
MRRFVVILSLAALVGCSKQDDSSASSSTSKLPDTSTTAAAPAPPATTPADFSGEWDLTVMPEGNDSVLTTSHLLATATATGWTMTLPGRAPVPLAVTFSGDSVMTIAPAYESVLRKGVMVSTSSVFHRNGNNLMGTTVARYTTTGSDSLVRLRSVGVRSPK